MDAEPGGAFTLGGVLGTALPPGPERHGTSLKAACPVGWGKSLTGNLRFMV
jgi:hypothetical protein